MGANLRSFFHRSLACLLLLSVVASSCSTTDDQAQAPFAGPEATAPNPVSEAEPAPLLPSDDNSPPATIVLHEPPPAPVPLPEEVSEFGPAAPGFSFQNVLVRLNREFTTRFGFLLCVRDVSAGWGTCSSAGAGTPATPVEVPNGNGDLEIYLLDENGQTGFVPLRRLLASSRADLAPAYRLVAGFDSVEAVFGEPPPGGHYLEADR